MSDRVAALDQVNLETPLGLLFQTIHQDHHLFGWWTMTIGVKVTDPGLIDGQIQEHTHPVGATLIMWIQIEHETKAANFASLIQRRGLRAPAQLETLTPRQSTQINLGIFLDDLIEIDGYGAHEGKIWVDVFELFEHTIDVSGAQPLRLCDRFGWFIVFLE